jgi:hypothetical protein
MPDDVQEKREQLARKIGEEFNKVSKKVVRVRQLADNFDNVAGENLGLLESFVAKRKMRELADKDPPAKPGVFVEPGPDGKEIGYVNTQFLKDTAVWLAKNGYMDGYEDTAVRSAAATVKAVEKSEDQTEKVKKGQIKPKAP